ncbi:serine protease [Parabacteroides sp. OttesenSCG-928-K15]|nr:serine protease [Parabacteroides sp. OttesenSCG-928-K15]
MAIYHSISDFISYSTIRIECRTSKGQTSTGTGFFFNFCKEGLAACPAIITNKHVIKDAVSCTLAFSLADNFGNPIDTLQHKVNIPDFQKPWKLHPNPNVDLCAMPIASIITILKRKGINPFYTALDDSFLPNESQKKEFQSMEDIVMVGYPNGIWDALNNKPIFRKGITATHPNIDYMGNKEFLIDAACFPGSSGSPVFIYNEIGYFDGKQFNFGKRRVLLLGVLYAGPQHFVKGEIQVEDRALTPVSVSSVPNNLGFVIKAENLLYFEELFKKELNELENDRT